MGALSIGFNENGFQLQSLIASIWIIKALVLHKGFLQIASKAAFTDE